MTAVTYADFPGPRGRAYRAAVIGSRGHVARGTPDPRLGPGARVTEPVTGRWRKPTITGERVTLRPVTAHDADGLWETVHDPEGNDLTATTAGSPASRSRTWCASRAAQDERLDLAVVDAATGEYAGEVVLNEHDPETDSANFRIALRGPACYGRGLGSEATRLVVDHALRTMGLQRLTLGVLARNPRARRAYEKAGFRRVRDYVEDGEDWVEMEVRRSHLDPDYPLLTERLLLRPIDPVRDLAAMHSYRSRADVCRYTPLVPGTTSSSSPSGSPTPSAPAR